MSKATDYNQDRLLAGHLTQAHIAELVRFFQAHNLVDQALAPDGMFGPLTAAALDKYLGATAKTGPVLRNPLPPLRSPGGLRLAQITSAFRTPSRPNHNGVDLFYRWQLGDKPDFVGDKGAATKLPDGTPKWVVPYGTYALAAADGRVQIAGNSSTGYRVWIDHGNGWRTGYFHLLNLEVHVGDEVKQGQQLGLVGDNPADHDGRHLHFELSPVDRYAPVDPAPYMVL